MSLAATCAVDCCTTQSLRLSASIDSHAMLPNPCRFVLASSSQALKRLISVVRLKSAVGKTVGVVALSGALLPSRKLGMSHFMCL
jgi:hypothetical protein